MKRLIILLSLSLLVNLVKADNFKVLFVNDANLKYKDGKVVKKGDIITDANTIKWEKERQAVKVINQSTKRQLLFIGKDWVRQSGSGAVVYIKHFSTQTSENNIYGNLFNTFDSQYGLMDKIEVPTDMELSDSCYFTVAYMYGDTKIVKKLGHEPGTVIIDNSLFQVDNSLLKPRDLVLSIEYVNEKEEKTIYVKDNIDLYIIPEKIE